MPCLREPCPNRPAWQPILKLRSKQEGPVTQLCFAEIAVCDAHRQDTTVASFLSAEGFDKLVRILKEAGKSAPVRRFIDLAWQKTEN
jgi:hypothetical protein